MLRNKMVVVLGIALTVLFLIAILNTTFFNSLRVELSNMQSQVSNMRLENEKLRSSLHELNKTLQLLTEAFRNKIREPGELLLKMEAKDVVSIGETMQVNLTLINLGTQPVTLTFPSSKIFDLKVVDSSGKVVYKWSQDKVFSTVITQIVLKPRESMSRILTWKCELPEGDYIITGIVESYGVNLFFSKQLKVVH
jgi:hypothetical protein